MGFYLKLQGDYYRYWAEVLPDGDDKEQKIYTAKQAYDQGQQSATELNPMHPVRLGLALNFSLFYMESQNKTDEAVKLAKTAFDEAWKKSQGKATEEAFKDSEALLRTLRDNLTLWTSD